MAKIKTCNINKILKQKKLTKKHLAEKCNMTSQHLGEIANGVRKGISLGTASKISKALQKNISQVFIME